MNRTRNSGFSLIEILVVIAIIGLMGVVAVVNLEGLTPGERLRSAARKLAGMSDFIRAQATGSKVPAYLEIDLDKHRYRFVQDPRRNQKGVPIDLETEIPLTDEQLTEWWDSFTWDNLPRDVYFVKVAFGSAGKNFYEKGVVPPIEYRPDGTSWTFVIHLQAAGATEEERKLLRSSILVNGLSGKSEVQMAWVDLPEASDYDFSLVMGSEAPGGAAPPPPTGETR